MSNKNENILIKQQSDGIYCVFHKYGTDPRSINLIATSCTKGNAVRIAIEKFPRCIIERDYLPANE